MWKCFHPFINLQDPALRSLPVSLAGWDSGGALFETIIQLCGSTPLTAISGDGVMDALTHWQIVFPHLCSLLTCPMAPAYYSMNFAIPQEQPDVPISREAASYCIQAIATWGNQQGSVLQQSLFSQTECVCHSGSHVGSAYSRTFTHFPSMLIFLLKRQKQIKLKSKQTCSSSGRFSITPS